MHKIGVNELKFEIKGQYLHIFDVCGQNSEQSKWMHCFERVTAVIYVASLACYDEVLFEDGEQNSMVQTIKLFERSTVRW